MRWQKVKSFKQTHVINGCVGYVIADINHIAPVVAFLSLSATNLQNSFRKVQHCQ
jgi:hypothetical protein